MISETDLVNAVRRGLHEQGSWSEKFEIPLAKSVLAVVEPLIRADERAKFRVAAFSAFMDHLGCATDDDVAETDAAGTTE